MGVETIAAVVGAAATVIILLFGDELLSDDKKFPAWLSRARWLRYVVGVPIGAALLWGAYTIFWGGRPSLADLKFKVGPVDAAQPVAAPYTTITRRALDKAFKEQGVTDQDSGVTIDATLETVGAETLAQTAGNTTEGSAEIRISFQRPGAARRDEMKHSAHTAGPFADAAIQNAIAEAASALAVKLKNGEFN